MPESQFLFSPLARPERTRRKIGQQRGKRRLLLEAVPHQRSNPQPRVPDHHLGLLPIPASRVLYHYPTLMYSLTFARPRLTVLADRLAESREQLQPRHS